LGSVPARRCNSVLGFPQAVLLPSSSPRVRHGPFARRELPPLRRYYGPLRLPAWQNYGYGFPSFVDLGSHPDPRSPSRGSQVPDRSLDACHPESPRGTHLLHLLVASRATSGFALSGRLTIPTDVTRPKGWIALRLTSSPSRAPTSGLPRSPPGRLHGERASAIVSTFQLARSTKLRLTHRIARNGQSRSPVFRRPRRCAHRSDRPRFSRPDAPDGTGGSEVRIIRVRSCLAHKKELVLIIVRWPPGAPPYTDRRRSYRRTTRGTVLA
jgi:hypothetical protein